MDAFVFAAVLVAAACHAGWNALIKFKLEPFTSTALISIASGLLAFPMVAVTGLPPLTATPWFVASVVLHFIYFISLIEAYRSGDMGQVYPIARGAAPLMTAALSAAVVGESLAPIGWAGIAVLAAGVLLLSMRGGKDVNFDARSVGFALFTAIIICGYSVVDGVGARRAGSAHAYTVALFACDGLVMALFLWLRRGASAIAGARQYWMQGLLGGALSLTAYWIAIWAMTKAPIALVAALRETSVLFGALIAVVVLGEPLRAVRIAAACFIVAGLVLIRLQ